MQQLAQKFVCNGRPLAKIMNKNEYLKKNININKKETNDRGRLSKWVSKTCVYDYYYAANK